MPEETKPKGNQQGRVSRRDFLKLNGVLAAAMGLKLYPPFAEGVLLPEKSLIPGSRQFASNTPPTGTRLPVIWLEFQDCAGCTEALTRAISPSLENLVLNSLTIEYHETLSAAAGFQVEQAKETAIKNYPGEYLLVVEGSIPVADNGVYCTIGGKTALELLKEAAVNAAAIIATGSCASFGGLPKADPDPTDSKGVMELIKDKPVVNIPGCPAIPEATAGTIFHFLNFGTLPELDELHRPKAFYGNTVHDRCTRRPFYEAGQFAQSFDDPGARKGWCLYQLGCKGPTTYNACSSIRWYQGLSSPVQSGHPCLGCSQPDFWDGRGFYRPRFSVEG